MAKVTYGGYTFLALDERLNLDEYIVVTFYVESKLPLEKVASAIAAESSVGTWTALSTMTKEIIKDKAAKVIGIDKRNKIVTIAYPNKLWETDNIAQLLSGAAGNVFGLKEIEKLRVLDIKFNEKYLRNFEGPQYGIHGVRDVLGVYDRPLLGTIIKPKLGLDYKRHAQVAYQAWIGGVDIVKDDENLTNQDFNNYYLRVRLTLEMKRKAEEETGEKKIYLPNVTARPDRLVRRAEFAKQEGSEAVMIDILTAGLSQVQYLRSLDLQLILHGHRAMHGAFTRDPRHGISMKVIAKLARLAGIDQLHIGTVVGKMEGGKEEVLELHYALKEPWPGIKPTLHVASGGLHPGSVQALVEILGTNDVIINMGGGIHGHPRGTYYGAKAAREAIELVAAGVDLEKAIKEDKYPELKQALYKWGLVDTDGGFKIPPKEEELLTHKNPLVS